LRSSSSLALSSRTSFMEVCVRVSGRSSSLSRSYIDQLTQYTNAWLKVRETYNLA
jgi:hypothetical protein